MKEIPKLPYPMRINKYLAQKGFSTRTGADELIQKGIVYINGARAVLGDKVMESDKVEVRHTKKPTAYTYVAYNKAKGVETGSPEATPRVPLGVASGSMLFPVGRLDKDSHGLLILTSDGRITDRLLNPVHNHEKEYTVRTKNKLQSNFKKIMEGGVDIEGYKTAPCEVKVTGDNTFNIILHEGKKHQIRRMVVAMKNEVTDLKRIRIMNILLGKLASSATRPIVGDELNEFLKSLGL